MLTRSTTPIRSYPPNLKDLNFGRTDARAEFLDDRRTSGSYFEDSFYVQDDLDVAGLEDGRYQFVTGLKGCGKTALLRYLLINREKNDELASFIVFKEKFSEKDRQHFPQGMRISALTEHSQISDAGGEFKEGWYWVILHHLSEVIKANSRFAATNLENYHQFNKLIDELFTSERPSFIRRIADYFQSAKVKIKGGIDHVISGEVEVKIKKPLHEVEYERSDLIDAAKLLIAQIKSPTRKRLTLFLDEIDLSHGTRKAYQRDCRLVRDLILAVNELNSLFIEFGTPINIICAIRSEILHSIATVGREINKAITDYELRVDWCTGQAGADHVILQIIEKKIAASELAIYGEVRTKDIWSAYFPDRVSGAPTARYLLKQTWFKPRDLVRYLNIAKTMYPRFPRFTAEALSEARNRFARESWTEITEELYAQYMPVQIDAIRRVFQGVRRGQFSYKFIETEIEMKGRSQESIKRLFKEKKTQDVMEDLFRIGVLGNEYNMEGQKRVENWAFLGSADLLLDRPFVLHPALMPIFEI